jgi:DNA-binding transcriptional ArsR family regulator
MTHNVSSVGEVDARKVLRALGMPRAVQLVRYMHMNGWFGLKGLEGPLGLDRNELLAHLAALEEAGLVERRASGSDRAVEFRLRRGMPELSLTKLATEEGPFLKAAKFYSNLVLGAIGRSRELNGGLCDLLKLEVSRANGWHDPKAKAVLSCLEVGSGPVRTYDNLRAMVAQGVLGDDDLPVLKKVFLSVLSAMVQCLESKSDRNISRLLLRVAAKDPLDWLGEDVRTYGLLDGLPEDYFRQV